MKGLTSINDSQSELIKGGYYYNPGTGAQGFVAHKLVGDALQAAQDRFEAARAASPYPQAVPPIDIAGSY